MIDYKQLDSIYELTEIYEKLSNNRAHVSMKLGSHPDACEYKLTVETDENTRDIYVYKTADELIDKLKELCQGLKNRPRFKIGDTIWLKGCEGQIESLIVKLVESLPNNTFNYCGERGWYVTSDDPIFASKNELIDHEIKKLLELKD